MGTGGIYYDNQGTISYNGVRFGSHSKLKISTAFEMDSAGRTVTAHRHNMTVSAIVTPDDAEGLDPTMEDLRFLLSQAGGALVIDQTGFGSLYVNGTVGTSDLGFGPKPRVLEWAPIGNNLAAEVVWQCEFMTSPCPDTADSGLMAFNYAVDYQINNKGYSTRTVSGALQIGMTRDGRTIPDTADAYREQIRVDAPANFKRTNQNYSLSEDKRTLQFAITDTEIESPNAWPAGVTEIDVRHRVRWAKRGRARKLLPNSITANITLAPDQPRARAWEIFRQIFLQRIGVAQQNTGTPVILESLECIEDLYGTNLSFSIEYTITAELSTFFTLTQVLAPISIDWQAWKQTMLLTESLRGPADLSHQPSEDRIVDICDTSPTTAQPYNQPFIPPIIGFQAYCNQRPSPEFSYIRFDATITDETETNTFLVKTLGAPSVTPNQFTSSDTSASIETVSSDALNLEIQGNPYMRFRWKGVAERVGYKIPKPHLTHIGEGASRVPVKLIGKPVFMLRYDGMIFCQPRYTAAWNFLYEVAERPQSLNSRGQDPIEGPQV